MKHHCHVPGCQAVVPPRLLMCSAHWSLVPPTLQQQVWARYRAGQEAGGVKVSRGYLVAAKEAIAAVVGTKGEVRP